MGSTTRDDKLDSGPRSTARTVWESIQSGPLLPRDDRDRKLIVFGNLLLHFRPVRLPAATLRYSHTFGLGGMSLVLFLLLMLTGILMIFVYEPSPGLAYESVVGLTGGMLFGKLVRNVHHWSANLLILVAFLHLLRVFFTGGHLGPRRFNWILGLALLACILASNFTGYLLPWDQLSYWATTIVTGMIGYLPLVGGKLQGLLRGGDEVGGSTLIIFYALHTTVIPVTLVALMAWHFWRVRKARGVVVPRAAGEPANEKPAQVLALPNLLLRELAVGLALTAFVLVVAFAFDAPLGDAANPGMSPNPAKAPWYFMGFQELLLHLHPLFAVLIVPLAGALALLALPYLRQDEDTAGVFMVSARGRRTAAMAAITALVLTPLWILLDEYWFDPAGWSMGLPGVVANGLIPAAVLLGGVAAFHFLLRTKLSATRAEARQAMFVLLVTGFLILTAAGVWFRGAGMALTGPGGGG